MEFWFPVAEYETVLKESISLKALLFLLHQKALPPQVQKQLHLTFLNLNLFPWTLRYTVVVIWVLQSIFNMGF